MNGILSGGVYIGGGLASLSILLDNSLGWRSTVFVIGVLGILIGIIGNFLILEPKSLTVKNNNENSNKESYTTNTNTNTNIDIDIDISKSVKSNIEKIKPINFTTIIPNLWANIISIKDLFLEISKKPETVYILLATGIRFCAGFTIGIWKAPFVFEKFPEEIAIFAGKIYMMY